MTPPLRLGVVRDYRAEGWPSMDLVADQLLAHLPAAVPGVAAVDIAPPFRRPFGRVPVLGRKPAAFNADRVVNRFVLLPRVVRRAARSLDAVHVADHSYAAAALAAPPGRAGVYLHDLDAFRCLLDPAAEPRPAWFRRMAARTLAGLRAAAVVFHNSQTVGRQARDADLVPADRLVHAPLGVSDEFAPAADASAPPPVAGRYVLHVGSGIPRKRLDVLLDVFAAVRRRLPDVRLVQLGGPWPPALCDRADRLGVGPGLVRFEGVSRAELAALYRGAAAVLVTSEAEGFGLPVIEALACGAAVVASDIPVLREVGADAVVFRPVADVPAWVDAVAGVVGNPSAAPPRGVRLGRAARFRWAEHARVIGEAYLRLAGERG